jgi:hypothetical protein
MQLKSMGCKGKEVAEGCESKLSRKPARDYLLLKLTFTFLYRVSVFEGYENGKGLHDIVRCDGAREQSTDTALRRQQK